MMPSFLSSIIIKMQMQVARGFSYYVFDVIIKAKMLCLMNARRLLWIQAQRSYSSHWTPTKVRSWSFQALYVQLSVGRPAHMLIASTLCWVQSSIPDSCKSKYNGYWLYVHKTTLVAPPLSKTKVNYNVVQSIYFFSSEIDTVIKRDPG